MTTFTDPYASSQETTEGRVYSVTGGDWDSLVTEIGATKEERVVLNMGPQHPSTHGVLRLILELEGETVTETRCGIGYLHTGIEKNTEFRNWTQGVTFVTRMDYLSPIFNETAYCLGVEKLLGITNDVTGEDVNIFIIPIINNIAVLDKGKYYDTGYPINIDEGSGIDFTGEISTVSTGSVDSIHVADGGSGHYVGQPVLFNNNNAGFGGTSSVESAVAEVTEVDYGSILLESAVRFVPSAFVTTGTKFAYKGRSYLVVSNGNLGTTGPVHTYGTYGSGTTLLKYVGKASSKLTNENGTATSLEQYRIYKTDANDNYDFTAPAVVNNLYGSIKAIRMLKKGKHYNSLPKFL